MKISLLLLSALLLNVNVFAQSVGINADGTAPNSSAMLDVRANNKGFLPPRMTNALKLAIGSPVAGLIVWCSDCGSHGEIQIYNGNYWTNITGGVPVSPFSCGSSFAVTHLASGGVAPVDKAVTYGTVTSSLSGASKCWITQNLGSDHQATSATDATEASAGWYWQFNRKQGFKMADDGTTRTPATTWISPISETSDWTAANDPCTIELGAGWRIPTNTEWTNAKTNGGWTNYTGTYNSVLKLHAAGYLGNSNGSLNGRGTVGSYWSSTQSDATYGLILYFEISFSGMSTGSNACGFSLRCLRD